MRFRGGLFPKTHRLLYHSTLGSRVIEKRKKKEGGLGGGGAGPRGGEGCQGPISRGENRRELRLMAAEACVAVAPVYIRRPCVHPWECVPPVALQMRGAGGSGRGNATGVPRAKENATLQDPTGGPCLDSYGDRGDADHPSPCRCGTGQNLEKNIGVGGGQGAEILALTEAGILKTGGAEVDMSRSRYISVNFEHENNESTKLEMGVRVRGLVRRGMSPWGCRACGRASSKILGLGE